jgi:thiamine biosynthesis lipoprotein
MEQTQPDTWQSHKFYAMGSHIVLWLDSPDGAAAQTAFAQVEALFAANEQALSRFRPSSELSRFNARSGEWVVVSELLWQQAVLAVQMANVTNGRFDPTLLDAVIEAGYGQSFETMIDGVGNGRWSAAPLLRQWKKIEFDEGRRALRFPDGVHLDLGGIAKGDTAQQAVALLQDSGPCLVDAGGDLVAGAAPLGYPGWPVAISAPWTDAASEPDDLATFWLAEGALATSGIDYRRWVRDGLVMHHLIDPLTGRPAETDGLTATVLAKEASTAEAWATATLVAGSTMGMAALLDHDLAGLIITNDGRILATPQMDQHLQGQLTTPLS